jgi:hypothetical protein
VINEVKKSKVDLGFFCFFFVIDVAAGIMLFKTWEEADSTWFGAAGVGAVVLGVFFGDWVFFFLWPVCAFWGFFALRCLFGGP